ncbi:MAG: hypothetical protein LBT38_01435 [Deltaproteobacteria bacterium]|nr:hypothetical protein [Deltaproteobacteria bacterium]
MTQNNEAGPTQTPKDEAGLWLWVLTAPITDRRDKLLILEDEGSDLLPVFQAKNQGQTFINRFDPGGQMGFRPQAMHFLDITSLAQEKAYQIVTLDGQGRILERWEPTPTA